MLIEKNDTLEEHKTLFQPAPFYSPVFSPIVHPSRTIQPNLLQAQIIPSSPTMGNIPGTKKKQALPIETSFKLPSPLPSWPSGGGDFAKRSIDLGGLEVCPVSTFSKIWASLEGGTDDLGASFFTPSPIPAGFSMLGSYAQPNNKPLFGWVLVAKDTTGNNASLANPVDYTLVWSSESSSIKQDGKGYIWLPTAPKGYKAVGHLVTNSPEKPSLDEVRCVRADLTDQCEDDELVWSGDGDAINVYNLRPATRSTKALGVRVGTFTAQSNGSSAASPLACLKNTSSNFSSMPNLSQINTLVQAYSPWVYFHSEENYLPSSLSWFFTNGALLYSKANTTPTHIDPTGSNLPQGGTNDGTYWLDLPVDDTEKDKVKRGDLQSAESYLHIKPMLGSTFTDIAIWVFYPFNGPAKAKVGLINIPLGKIGEHVGDWEHVTLRVSNFTGELWRVYFSEHSGGTWVDASELEFQGGNKVVAYASLSGHAFYSKAGLVLQGDSKLGAGIRNDTEKGKYSMDAGSRYEVVGAEYLGSAVVEPPWLNYLREWGPKISYEIETQLEAVEKLLPGKLKNAVEDLVNSLPDELRGEEGPTGPKVKDSWNMDEKV